MKNTFDHSNSEILRQQAEELLKKKLPKTVSSLSESDTLKLIHELEVHQFELVIQNESLSLHQLELEMQNKELLHAKEKAETDAKKYAELYDFAPAGYFTLSHEGTVTEVNFSGATMLGKARAQLTDNRFGVFVSDDTKPIFNLFLDKVFSSKANQSCDVTLSTRGNLPMFVHLTGIVNENGKQCLVSMVDITDSRIMTALQQSEQRFRAVVEWSPYSIVIHRDLKIVYVNPAAIKMFGASSAQDFVGTKVLDRVHPDCHQIVLDRIRRGIDDGIKAPLTELKYFKFDGTIIDVEVQGTPITYDGVPCIHAAMRDITERKKVEVALHESEANLRISHRYTRSLIEASLDPMVTIDQDGKISDVNSATENATGLSRNQLIGTEFSDYFTEPEKAKIGYQKVFEQGKVINYPLTICHTSGKLIDVQYNASIFKDEHGKILGVFAAARDVTELLQIEKKLRKSEKTHHSLFEISLQGIVYQNSEGFIVNANPAARRILGLTLDQLQGRTSFDPNWRAMKEDGSDFPGEEHPAILSLKTGKIIQNVVMGVFNPADAIVHWIKINASPLFSDGESAPQMVYTVFEDITEHRQAEDKLQQSHARYTSMTSNISDVIGIMDADGIMTYKSPNIEKWFGWLGEDRVGTSGFSTVHPDDLDRVGKVFYSLLEKDNSVKTLEFRYLCKDGSYKPIELTASNLLNDPFIHGVLLNYRDITARKQIEGELEQTATRLALATKAGGVGVWDWDIDNNVLVWDDQMIALYGIDKKNFSGAYQAWQEGLHPDDVLRGDHEIQMAISGKKEFNTEFRVLWPDGTTRYIRALAVVQRDESGKALHMIGTNWDITSQKNAEQTLLESKDDLQKTNTEKDKFFSIISHDLRGPFNGFLGLSKLMAEESSDLTQEEIQKMAGAMRDSATNLFNLLENLLEWSRMQQGGIIFNPESIWLMSIMDESMHPVMDSADKKGVEISYEIPNNLEVFADQYMLASTIRNLASNAVKFTTKGGKVTIVANTIPGNSVEISVSDTGIGMSPEMVHDLFRLDVQTNRRGTENEPSSGLGLLLCKDFVEKHGGKLWVESEEGKGSVFYFTIPNHAEVLIKNVIIHGVSEEDKEVQIKRMKILIAEDDFPSDLMLTRTLKEISREVLHVKTGVEAIDACRNNPDLDLVLMDICMPGMSGYDATRQIRQFNKKVIIIVQTAEVIVGSRKMAIEAGCNDYIEKPIDKDELLTLIHKYFKP